MPSVEVEARYFESEEKVTDRTEAEWDGRHLKVFEAERSWRRVKVSLPPIAIRFPSGLNERVLVDPRMLARVFGFSIEDSPRVKSEGSFSGPPKANSLLFLGLIAIVLNSSSQVNS